jgi:hypothetical protein
MLAVLHERTGGWLAVIGRAASPSEKTARVQCISTKIVEAKATTIAKPLNFIDKKIFQNVLPVCWGERFFADSAINQAARKFRIRMHTNMLVV